MNDDEAAALEKELQGFRGDSWPHLNLESATVKGDFFQIGKQSSVFTSDEFSGPLEINVSARTEKENIRIRAGRGASVIFNWEVNPGQLRVCRPDGNDQAESGSLSTASVTPLKPGVWYKLRWRITGQGMQVFVNDEIVFDEMRTYDLATRSRISIRAEHSLVDVRDFYVVRLTQP
ncbi:MAG: hypothetical protein JSS49_01965 [Planctomycetes bacterium]|nr:hypothetical protein [Planctomycetota bacterium]